MVALIEGWAEPTRKGRFRKTSRKFSVRVDYSLLILLALLGCDDSPKTYSTCILKGTSSGGNNYAIMLATHTCEDKFRSNLDMYPQGSAQIVFESGQPKIIFSLTNTDRNYLILNLMINYTLLDAPNGNFINAYVFTFESHIRPGEEATFKGNLPGSPAGWRWKIAKVEGVNVR